MSALTKIGSFSFTPGSPGVPGTAGFSAIPGHYESYQALVYPPGHWVYLPASTGFNPKPARFIFISDDAAHPNGTYVTLQRYVPPVPAVPPTPGVPGSPNVYAANLNLGWTASARSVNTLAGNGNYQITVQASCFGIITGLRDFSNYSTAYTAIQYGFYFTHGQYKIIESGAFLSANVPFTNTDVFTIERRGSTISYYVNGALVYTSLVQNTRELYAAASLYSANDEILTAALSTTAFVSKSGAALSLLPLTSSNAGSTYRSIGASLRPMTASAHGHTVVGAVVKLQTMTALAANKHYGASSASFAPLTTSLGGHVGVVSATALAVMTSVASNKPYGGGNTTLQPLTAQGSSGFIVPSVAVSSTSLTYLTSYGHVLVGQGGSIASTMALMTARASNKPYGDSVTQLTPLQTFSGNFAAIGGVAVLKAAHARMASAGSAGAPNSFMGVARFLVVARGGDTARLIGPSPRLTASATAGTYGTGTLKARAGMLVASGTNGATASGVLSVHARFKVTAYSGAVLAVTTQGQFTVVASGTAGALGKAVMRLPLFQLTASGHLENHGAAILKAPLAQMAVSGVARIIGPRARLQAIGSATVAFVGEAYAMQMLTDPQNPNPVRAVSHYPSYPFTQIVRFNGHYYGVNPTGLFLLEGDTDNGQTISWSFATALDDFNTKQLKRVSSMYVDGRISTSCEVDVIVGEKETDVYTYSAVRGNDIQNYRVPLGKGLRSRYFGFGVADGTGHKSEVDSFDLEIDILKRAI